MINRSIKRLFAVLGLLASAGMIAKASQSNNLFLARAFSANSAREMVMMGAPDKNADGWAANFSVAGSYQRMWEQDKGKGIGSRPFWSGTNVMTTGAADATGTKNLDPWHMGLGVSTGDGSFQLDPVVYQAGADFLLAVNASANEPGFYGSVKGSVAVMSIDPKLTEAKKVTTVQYATKTVNATGTVDVVYKNMTEAFVGDKEYGDVQKRTFGNINGKQSVTKFGDIELALGYNLLADEDKCLGIGLRASGPTGNKPEGVYVLEPVVGRGGSWGLGGELKGHMVAWEGSSGDKALNVKLNANAMHLFKSKSPRSYDLKDSVGSKYMLAAHIDDAGTAYQSKISNLINFSTLESESSFGVEADASLALEYNTGNWAGTLGYNFWGRSEEKLTITGESTQVLGLLSRLDAHDLSTPTVNPTAKISTSAAAAAPTAANTFKVSADTLNVDGAKALAACSSKVFGALRYNWMDSDYMPHLGLMGEFELSHSDNNALPQWSVGVEGGVSF